MSRKESAARTRRKVLDAAKAEFAENGLNGARIEAIAHRSGCNVQLIYHYFDNKDGLYAAVIGELFEQDTVMTEWKGVDALDPEAAIVLLLRSMSKRYLSDPAYVPLVNDENSHKARHLRNAPAIRAQYATLMETLSRVLKRGQKLGRFGDGIDAELFYVMASNAIGGYITGSHLIAAAFGQKPPGKQRTKAHVDRINRLLLRALRPD